MTIQEMKQRKAELGYSIKMLSEISGVPEGTIQKIFSGETSFPRYSTIMALEEALSPQTTVNEPEPAYNVKPLRLSHAYDNYTLADREALPDDVRCELIDGKIYDMASPSVLHQRIALDIYYRLMHFVAENRGKCIPFCAPTDVQLDKDDKTVVIPDVFVVCDRDKINYKWVVGAPDLVVEVISPSTATKDIAIKLNKYRDAGVKEYWIVFPIEMRVWVYDFTKSEIPVQYTFDDKVPVGIWNGECMVDFKEIYENNSFIFV